MRARLRSRLLRKGARHAEAAAFQADKIITGPALGVRQQRAREGGKFAGKR